MTQKIRVLQSEYLNNWIPLLIYYGIFRFKRHISGPVLSEDEPTFDMHYTSVRIILNNPVNPQESVTGRALVAPNQYLCRVYKNGFLVREVVSSASRKVRKQRREIK